MLRNINRIICFALVLCFAFSMSSCYGLKGLFGADSEHVGSEETDSEETEAIFYDYESIECKKSSGTKYNYFVFDDDDIKALSLAFPMEWTISKGQYEHDVFRDNEKIGTVKTGKADTLQSETVCYSETGASSGINYEWSIIHTGVEFIHRIVYTCKIAGKSHSMTLEIGYDELNEIGLRRARFSPSIKNISTDPGFGTINLSASSKGKPILILGNSFIGSSRVGAILERMCKAGGKTEHQILWESRGMATVSNQWSDYLNQMRNGDFAAVFMCGFYGSGDVSAFKSFVDACEASNTTLVIFPAHNESNGSSAASTYRSLHFLNWKGELDTLIASGVDRWDLCIDDYHRHSQPLAGYVGAHMIYRALFGEVPPILSQYDEVSYSTITQKLGDYSQTGAIWVVKDDVAVHKMN